MFVEIEYVWFNNLLDDTICDWREREKVGQRKIFGQSIEKVLGIVCEIEKGIS